MFSQAKCVVNCCTHLKGRFWSYVQGCPSEITLIFQAEFISSILFNNITVLKSSFFPEPLSVQIAMLCYHRSGYKWEHSITHKCGD